MIYIINKIQMASSINTYNNLDETVKLQRSQSIKSDTSSKLYATLMMTKEDNSRRESAKNAKIKDLLVVDSKEQLSESDKEKIWYTLDYLRIRWVDSSIFSKLATGDFSKIKNHKTTSDRAEALVQLVIEKAGESLGIKNSEMDKFKKDIDDRVNAIMRWRNAEVGNNIAEDISLTKWTTSRARFYGDKIKGIIAKHTDETTGEIKWDEGNCYMEVIKNANYATIPMRKKTFTRYTVPIKFSWRDINKQTENTLNALKQKSEESKDNKERFAINSIIKNLQWAYNHYKKKIWVSNKAFDEAKRSNEDRIYRNAA